MEAVQFKDGSGYYVLVTWPNGAEEHVGQAGDFSNEEEANDWITDDAPGWLRDHPRSR